MFRTDNSSFFLEKIANVKETDNNVFPSQCVNCCKGRNNTLVGHFQDTNSRLPDAVRTEPVPRIGLH